MGERGYLGRPPRSAWRVSGLPEERAADTGPLMAPGAPLRSKDVQRLQQLSGNAAVAGLFRSPEPVAQREVDESGQTGDGTLGDEHGPVSQPDLAEGGGGGGELIPAAVNEFGEMDGELVTGVEVHVFTDGGRTSSGLWHHCGGTGGVGNENAGSSTVVAPVYESAPGAKAGAPASAWVKAGTGKVTVKRSWTGVTSGDNGTATWAGSAGGKVYVTPAAATRMARHERGHVAASLRIHDRQILPMESRIRARKTGASEAGATAAMKAHVAWNTTLAAFAAEDITANQPGGTWDTTDQSKADFYQDKGPKKLGGVNYAHYIDAT